MSGKSSEILLSGIESVIVTVLKGIPRKVMRVEGGQSFSGDDSMLRRSNISCVASSKIIYVIGGEVSHLLMHKLNSAGGALAGKRGRAKIKGQNSVKEKKLITHKAQQSDSHWG